MRRFTTHILVAVIIASLTCLAGLFVVGQNIRSFATLYEEQLIQYSDGQRIVAKLSGHTYHVESLIWQHIEAADEESYDRIEGKIDTLLDEMQGMFSELNSRVTTEEESQLLHDTVVKFAAFNNNRDVTLELSRTGDKLGAQYYVKNTLVPFYDDLNDMLVRFNTTMDAKRGSASTNVRNSIDTTKTAVWVCVILSVLMVGICLIIVLSRSDAIEGKQQEEQRSHAEEVENLQQRTIEAMAGLIEGRDEDTGEHVQRTSWLVRSLATELKAEGAYKSIVDDDFIDLVEKAAPMHDIGKIAISDTILCKPGKLTMEEFETMKTHSAIGGDLVVKTLSGIESPEYVQMAHDVARFHHEKWNGTGYPEGLSGETIPLCARIMAVADVFDALVSKRCYKPARTPAEAYQIIEESAGSHFDPVCASAFLAIRSQVEAYLDREKKEGRL